MLFPNLLRILSFNTLSLCALLIVASPANSSELLQLGQEEFTCKKGELRFDTPKGSRSYPAGKYEEIRIPTTTGILSYNCRYLRRTIICPIDTIFISVKRKSTPGKFAVGCFGQLKSGLSGSPTSPEIPEISEQNKPVE